MTIDLSSDDPAEPEPDVIESHTSVGRVAFLDGLRGTMCVVVIVFHAIQQFPETLELREYLLSGTRAVDVFWGVSGYALALIDNRDRAVLTVIGRLPRLMLPVVFLGFVTAIISFAIDLDPMVFVSTQKAIAEKFLLNDFQFEPFGHGQNHNWEHLWTMYIELYGSLALLFGHELFKETKQPVRLVCALALLALYVEPNLNFILIGYVLCKWEPVKQWFTKHYNTNAGLLMSGLSLIMFFCTLLANDRQLVRYIGAASIFVCILSTQKMEKVFDNVFTSFFGRYSFELYISHYPILQRCYDIPWVNRYPMAMVATLLALSIAWSLLVQRHVNTASLVFSKKIARALSN